MRVTELKAITRERGLRGYSQLRKAELIALFRPAPQTRPAGPHEQRPPRPSKGPWPPAPRRPPPQSVRFRPDRLTQPSLQEMNIFKQQEMSKSQPQVTSKLNDWYDWLVNNVPKTIKDCASRAFKTFKDKIMGLYNRVTGNQTQRKELNEPEPEPFNSTELE